MPWKSVVMAGKMRPHQIFGTLFLTIYLRQVI